MSWIPSQMNAAGEGRSHMFYKWMSFEFITSLIMIRVSSNLLLLSLQHVLRKRYYLLFSHSNRSIQNNARGTKLKGKYRRHVLISTALCDLVFIYFFLIIED